MTALALSLLQSAQQLLVVSLKALDEVPAPENVKPGYIALGSFLLLCAVTVLLWLNMRKQLGRITFDDGVDRSQKLEPRFPTAEPGSTSSATGEDRTTPPADSGTPRA